MLKYISSFFIKSNTSNDTTLSLDEAYSIITQDDDATSPESTIREEITAEPVLATYETCTKIGKITEILPNDAYTIDSTHTFTSSTPFQLGSTISYQLISTDGELKVIGADLIENDWNVVDTGEKRTWHLRTLICSVESRCGRVFTLKPGDIKLNLNEVSAQFVPIVGDWVELDVKCEADEYVADLSGRVLEIERVGPVRSQVKSGQITQWNAAEKWGTLSRNVYFNRDALCSGYIPVVGDKVVAEVIESNQGHCVWRALKIVPDYIPNRSKARLGNMPVDGDFEEEREGLSITDGVQLTFTKLGEAKQFIVEIEAKVPNFRLISVEIPKTGGQIALVTEIDHFDLQPTRPLSIRLKSYAKQIGETQEMIVFHFESFKIRRWIKILVSDSKNSKIGANYVNKSKEIDIWDKREVIVGRKIKLSARFQSFSIPDYTLPQRIFNLVVKYNSVSDALVLRQEMESMKGSLVAPLNYMNYEDKLHTLLHLDEAHCKVEMRVYDVARACFIKSGEFLMLEIENLAEKRPSVIVGDKVYARHINNDKSPDYQAFVHKTGKNHVYLKFSQIFHDSYDGEDYTVKIEASRTTYRREHHAVHLASRYLGKEWLFPTKVVEKEPQIEFTFDPYEDCLNPEAKKIEIKVRGRDRARLLQKIKKFNENNQQEVPIVKLQWHNQNLNFYQKEAVRNVLVGACRPLPYLIFGPPGTGKTVTLVEIILQILRLMPHARLLVAAPSNSAADLLALRLIETGVVRPGDLVRLVSFTAVDKVPAKLAPYCATSNVEIAGTETNCPVVTPSGLVLGYSSSVIGRHKITVSTCSNAAVLYSMGFPRGHFSHIIVDEAGQTSEPSALIPMSFLDTSSGQAVMAGDPMQLGPVILSRLAAEYGLEESLLERLINRFPYMRDADGFPNSYGYDPRLITKLIYNYRSLPDILKLPSLLFYNDDLITTISADDSDEARFLDNLREVLPQLKNGKPASLVFHGVKGKNFQTEDSPSWFNPNEAAQVFFYVNEFYRLGVKNTDIGVISPYKAQAKQLMDLFKEADFDAPKIGTIEEFQGQESQIIILSTVRSTKGQVQKDLKYSLGFISSPRRLNVSLTRAKSLMVVIGNGDVLVVDRCWRAVINFCIENGAYVGCPLKNVEDDIDNDRE